MSYLIAAIAGIAGTAFGWYAGDAAVPMAADSIARLPDIGHFKQFLDPDDVRELAAGLGLLIAVWLVLRIYAGHRSFRALVWRGLAVVIVVGTLTAATARVGAVVFEQIGMIPGAPSLAFEIRLPAARLPSTKPGDIQVELHTDKNQAIASVGGAEREGDMLLIRGTVPILFRTAQRSIVLSLPGEPLRTFKLHLGASPLKNAEFSPWQEPETAEVAADVAIRYRAF